MPEPELVTFFCTMLPTIYNSQSFPIFGVSECPKHHLSNKNAGDTVSQKRCKTKALPYVT